MVTAEDGLKPIEEVTAGDFVYSENPETGEKGLKKVVQTFVNETEELIHIHADGQDIVTTPEHPFYVPVKGWTNAADLRAGDILVTVNGEYKVVEKIQHELLESPIQVYNFEVEDFHTYYVGGSGVLVHNTCALNSSQAKKLAEKLGFKKIKELSHGQPVFKKGKKYITPDVGSGNGSGSHNGGVWKMANSVKNLARKETRMGTYDANLKKIGD